MDNNKYTNQAGITIEEKEFKQLVAEMRPLNFTRSEQVSNYIKKNNLARKYEHIAGRLKMHRDIDMWTFDGGIAPKFYARLCQELGLSNKKTNSRVLDFTPYSQVQNI